MNPNDAKTEAAAGAALAAVAAALPDPIEHDTHDQDATSLYTYVLRDGLRVETVDLEKHRYAPRDKRGHLHVHTPDALVAYAKRHLNPAEATLWADVDAARVTVVLNDHGTDDSTELAGWADHRAELVLRRSPEWKAWADLNEIEAKAGVSGDTTVPRDFVVALRPFLGHEPVMVKGRFTYRVREGTLALGYKLLNLDDISPEAVMPIVNDVAGRLDLPAIEGTAPGARR